MDRRTLIKLLLGTALAEAVDVERLLWVPKPIVTVPEFKSAIVGWDMAGWPVLDADLTHISLGYITPQDEYIMDRVFPRKLVTIKGMWA